MDILQLKKEVAWYAEEVRVHEHNLKEAEDWVTEDVRKMEACRQTLAENKKKLDELRHELEIAERQEGTKSSHSSNEFEYF